MNATRSASRPDAQSPSPESAAAETPFNANDLRHLEILRELTASWHPVSTVADRRPERRIPCNFRADLLPLDEDGRPTGEPSLEIHVIDRSTRGIGIVHRHPMPHRLVLITYVSDAGEMLRLLVRLKWCRFKRADFYQSGGQIVRAVADDDSLAS